MLHNPTTGASLDFIDPTTGESKCYPITGTGANGVTINTIGTSTVAASPAAGAVDDHVQSSAPEQLRHDRRGWL